MHEFGIAENIFNTLKEAKAANDIKRVLSVNIKAGALLHIVPETLKFAFESLIEGSDFEDVQLLLKIDENKIKCLKCDAEMPYDKNILKCEKCGSDKLKLSGSKELVIESIEVE